MATVSLTAARGAMLLQAFRGPVTTRQIQAAVNLWLSAAAKEGLAARTENGTYGLTEAGCADKFETPEIGRETTKVTVPKGAPKPPPKQRRALPNSVGVMTILGGWGEVVQLLCECGEFEQRRRKKVFRAINQKRRSCCQKCVAKSTRKALYK